MEITQESDSKENPSKRGPNTPEPIVGSPSTDAPRNPKAPRRRNEWANKRNNVPSSASKDEQPQKPDTPIQAMFRGFSTILDEQNDRRERIIKISRDVTINSKRLIFLLHRSLDTASSKEEVLKQAEESLVPIRQLLEKITDELVGQDYYRYQRAFSPGLQEYLEAVSFLEYIRSGEILTKEQAEKDIQAANSKGMPFMITLTDYLLGISDLTGELMRLCINCVTNGNHDKVYEVAAFIRRMYDCFRTLESTGHHEIPKKLNEMRSSLQKVENVCFNVKVRGSEYPKEMLANMDGGDEPMEE